MTVDLTIKLRGVLSIVNTDRGVEVRTTDGQTILLQPGGTALLDEAPGLAKAKPKPAPVGLPASPDRPTTFTPAYLDAQREARAKAKAERKAAARKAKKAAARPAGPVATAPHKAAQPKVPAQKPAVAPPKPSEKPATRKPSEPAKAKETASEGQNGAKAPAAAQAEAGATH